MDKKDEVYIHNGILLTHKKNEIMLGIIILRERSQTEKDKYHMISLICGILKKKKSINELIYKIERPTDIENKLMVTNRERVGER